MAHLISASNVRISLKCAQPSWPQMCKSASNVQICLKCANLSQMCRNGLKCAESALNVQNWPQCVHWPQCAQPSWAQMCRICLNVCIGLSVHRMELSDWLGYIT